MDGQQGDTMAERQERAAKWFGQLRDDICAGFEAIESDSHKSGGPDQHRGGAAPATFERKDWKRDGGGGGQMSILRGDVFEKAGVNISTVHGRFSEEFRAEVPGAAQDGRFWATGISVVAHPRNPHVPAAHMNTRFITTSRAWFGGGGDLTPMLGDDGAAKTFHDALKAACDAHDPDYYARYKEWCDKYFHLPHRGEPRGVGGIFYDSLDSGDWEADFAFTRDVGAHFSRVYQAIVRARMDRPWSEDERHEQLVRRGRYVEFNLLYDRGTRFGLRTQGNIEAIFMSLPPEVRWP